MLEFIWKISVIAVIALCGFATLGVGLIWAAPRFEQKVMDRPRLLMAVCVCVTMAAWLMLGYVGFAHTPEGVIDEIAQWGGRVLFIGAPALVIAAISYFIFHNQEERS